MISSALAFDRFSFDDRAFDQAPVRQMRPVECVVERDAAFLALVEEIGRHEGQVVSNPPLLFKLAVVVGLGITAAGLIGFAVGIVELASRFA